MSTTTEIPITELMEWIEKYFYGEARWSVLKEFLEMQTRDAEQADEAVGTVAGSTSPNDLEKDNN